MASVSMLYCAHAIFGSPQPHSVSILKTRHNIITWA
jgi:hypothetical protein